MEIRKEDYNREAVYREIPWPRRQALHRQIALHLQAGQASHDELAEHWLAAREFEQNHQALLASAEAWYWIHAYRVVGYSPAPVLVIRPEEELTK